MLCITLSNKKAPTLERFFVYIGYLCDFEQFALSDESLITFLKDLSSLDASTHRDAAAEDYVFFKSVEVIYLTTRCSRNQDTGSVLERSGTQEAVSTKARLG